jgi:hypothetical protein
VLPKYQDDPTVQSPGNGSFLQGVSRVTKMKPFCSLSLFWLLIAPNFLLSFFAVAADQIKTHTNKNEG